MSPARSRHSRTARRHVLQEDSPDQIVEPIGDVVARATK